MIPANYFRNLKPALWLMVALQAFLPSQNAVAAATTIDNQPIFVTNNVPPNMMLALSVEWPTGVVGAYRSNYVEATRYVGYFDPTFCYSYYKNNGTTVDNTPVTLLTSGRTAAAAAQEYFRPVALGTGASLHQQVARPSVETS